jgi:hypothetical protein
MADIMKEVGITKTVPDLTGLVDVSYLPETTDPRHSATDAASAKSPG